MPNALTELAWPGYSERVLGSGDLSLSVPIATVEDTIISKLEWYRLTDETTDRQWDDELPQCR